MSDEMNVLEKRANETGYLQDVIDVLDSFGVNEKDALLIGSSISSWAYEASKKIIEEGGEELPLEFLTKSGAAITLTINIIEEGATPKAIALFAANYLVNTATTSAVAAVLASAGVGAFAVAGAGVIAGVAAGLAIDYLAESAWDTFIGPNAEIIANDITKEYSFTVNGALSDFLQPRSAFWQGVNEVLDFFPGEDSTASNVWEKFDLVDANIWYLEAADNQKEPLTVIYDINEGFIFSGVSGSFRDIYNSEIGSDQFSLGDNEHKKIINLILENFGGDFNVTTSTGSDYVYNLAIKTEQQLVELAKSADDAIAKRTLLSLSTLSFFALESEEWLSESVDPNNYSDQYIKDRANFLFHLTHDDAPASDGNDTTFIDMQLGTTKSVGNGIPNPLTDDQLYIFGEGNDLLGEDLTTGNDIIEGKSKDDHLYGMGGDDTIKGHEGVDYIEGGEGQDTMYGGDDNDTFFIQGEDEAYDNFYGEAGTKDKILGSNKSEVKDVIRLHNFDYETNSIEEIDGQAGENIIAGTDNDDTIDLSGVTTVRNIARIEGGSGSDELTGTSQDDILYGGSTEQIEDNERDRLIGGEGVDTYHIGAGDVISDLDGDGSICFNGQEFTNLSLSQISEGSKYYNSQDNSYSAIFDEVTGKLTLSAVDSSNSFIIENYSIGGFGIDLEEWTPSSGDYQITLNGTTGMDVVDYTVEGDNAVYFTFSRLTTQRLDGTWNSETIYSNDLLPLTTSFKIIGSDNHDRLAGMHGADHLIGGDGNDALWGISSFDLPSVLNQAGDKLEGGVGNDWVSGSGGEDNISGGDDMDFLTGLLGNDTITGDSGNDILVGGGHEDFLTGGSGDDVILGDGDLLLRADSELSDTLSFSLTRNSDNFVTGIDSDDVQLVFGSVEVGNDYLFGGIGDDYLNGGSHNDNLFGEDGQDTLIGADGDDKLYGGENKDLLIGDNGDGTGSGLDILYGGDGNDQLQGGGGNDKLYGEADDDILYGQDDDDHLYGGAGSDSLLGNSGDDHLYGGADDDFLYGDEADGTGTGMDVLHGGSGGDLLRGGGGNDQLYGEEGDDNLSGQVGDDILIGGLGNDYLKGDSGSDEYHFSLGDGIDVVEDSSGSNTILLNDAYDIDSLIFSYVNLNADTAVMDPNGQDLGIYYTNNDAVFVKDGRTNSSFSYTFGSGNSYTHSYISSLLQSPQSGSAYNDGLVGGDGRDSLFGYDGNDYLYGEAGNDVLSGGNGNDHLIGGEGADLLIGGEGTDSAQYTTSSTAIFGNLLTGEMHGGDAEGDILVSIENLLGSNHNDTLTGDNQNNALWGYAGNDTIYGLDGDDYFQDGYIQNESGDDVFYGGAGNDYMVGMGGSDRLLGGEGNDKYVFNPGDGIDFISDQEGINKIIFGRPAGITLDQLRVFHATINDDMTAVSINPYGSDLLIKYTENDAIAIVDGRSDLSLTYDLQNTGQNTAHSTILGLVPPGLQFGDENDNVNGTAGDDLIYGGGGNDTIYGLDGVDELYGQTGNDTLYGGNGDDYLEGGAGADVLDGGEGLNDTAKYSTSSTGVTVDLSTGLGSGGDAEGDQLISIENLEGSIFTDTLTGNSDDNTLNGDEGNDVIFGGYGNDTIFTGIGNDMVSAGAGDDNIWFDGGNNQIYGDTGDDFISASSNNHDRIRNEIFGGEGNDQLLGGRGNDILEGGQGDDELYGYGGSDFVKGGEGNDTIDAIKGSGDSRTIDILEGGIGNDTYLFGKDWEGRDYINDQDGTNQIKFISPYEGASPLGIDDLQVYYYDADLEYTINAINSFDYNGNYWHQDLRYNIDELEDFKGNYRSRDWSYDINTNDLILYFDIPYEEGEWNNIVVLVDGRESLDYVYDFGDGGLYSHSVIQDLAFLNSLNGYNGGEGEDGIYYTNQDETITSTDAHDIIYGEGGDDIIYGFDGADRLNGGSGNDIIYGGDGNDILTGGNGDDIFFGGARLDVIYGGNGIDLSDYRHSSFGVNINIFERSSNLAFDYSNTRLYEDILIDVENVYGSEFNDTFTGSGVANKLLGYGGDDLLFGNGGNDNLQGGDGQDELYGGHGDDFLRGGEGADIIDGGDGRDAIDYRDSTTGVTIDLAAGTVSGGSGEGDSLISIENGYGSNLDDSITGNDERNTLIGFIGNDELYGGGENDNLQGREGDDTLYGGLGDDFLRGGEGADILDGGDGRDAIDYRDSTVGVTIDLAAGTVNGGSGEGDSLISIENGYGSDFDDSITGNDERNTLIGFIGNDELYGGGENDNLQGREGDDTLSGGLGNDVLSGGEGVDHFLFDTALDQGTNIDSISDFTIDEDFLVLSKTIFSAIQSNDGTLLTENFNASLTGVAADENDYILYNTTSGVLLYDADGSGSGVALEFATLSSKPEITARDFIIAS